MSRLLSRRAFAAIAVLTVTGAALSACGKKGSPLPPRDVPSDYPRVYPSPSRYPHPTQPGGQTIQSPRPEQQQPTADGAVTGEPGTSGQ